MNDDFAPFELAVKLKEKGFNLHCVSFYVLENFTAEYVDSCGDCYEVDFEKGILYLNHPLRYNKFEEKMLPAPTISQVLKWLRKEKKIYVSILPVATFSTVDEVAFYYLIEYNSTGETMESIEQDNYCVEWNDAAFGGIEYVLDNLI